MVKQYLFLFSSAVLQLLLSHGSVRPVRSIVVEAFIRVVIVGV